MSEKCSNKETNMVRPYIFLLLAITLLSSNLSGQSQDKTTQEIGINLLQIPATTLELNYHLAIKPRYSMVVNAGYTLNYVESFDLTGFLLSPHFKCGNNGYSLTNQSGTFLQTGIRYNLRKVLNDYNYFFLGGYLSQSLVHEKTEYVDPEAFAPPVASFQHLIYIIGFSGELGYNFNLCKQLQTEIAARISFPSKKYNDLYGYSHYIPGMGYMETCGGAKIFPMIALNLKYNLNNR